MSESMKDEIVTLDDLAAKPDGLYLVGEYGKDGVLRPVERTFDLWDINTNTFNPNVRGRLIGRVRPDDGRPLPHGVNYAVSVNGRQVIANYVPIDSPLEA